MNSPIQLCEVQKTLKFQFIKQVQFHSNLKLQFFRIEIMSSRISMMMSEKYFLYVISPEKKQNETKTKEQEKINNKINVLRDIFVHSISFTKQ